MNFPKEKDEELNKETEKSLIYNYLHSSTELGSDLDGKDGSNHANRSKHLNSCSKFNADMSLIPCSPCHQ